MADSLPPTWSEELKATKADAHGARLYSSFGGVAVQFGTVRKAVACDPKTLKITHVICTALEDKQQDVIEPGGADLSYHRDHPFVYYDHGQGDYTLPVAKSTDPGGNYSVRMVGDRLLADTFFAPTKMGEDLFRLYESDILNGWSVGMVPRNEPGAYSPLGPVSKSLGRPPMHFRDWQLLEYSATPAPVNPEALTILVEKGRLAGVPLDPVILKSLRPFAALNRTASVVVPPNPLIITPSRGVTKAMSAANMMSQNMGPDSDAAQTGPSMPTPTAKHSYDGAQGVSDIADHIEQGLSQCEHAKGKKRLKKILDDLRAAVNELKANGDMVGADLDDKPDEQDAMVDEPEPVSKSETGLILITKASYAPKRWTTRDVAEALAADGVSTNPNTPPASEIRKGRKEREAEKEEARRAKALAEYQENVRKFPQLFPALTKV
jgi:hypothetical protein